MIGHFSNIKSFLDNKNAADFYPGQILQVPGGNILRESNVSLVEPNKLQNLLNEERLNNEVRDGKTFSFNFITAVFNVAIFILAFLHYSAETMSFSYFQQVGRGN